MSNYFRFYEIDGKTYTVPERRIVKLCYLRHNPDEYIVRYKDLDNLAYKIYGELLSETWLNNHPEQDILRNLLYSCESVDFPCISKDMLCICYDKSMQKWEIFNLGDISFDEVWIKPQGSAELYITLSNLKRLEDDKKCS